jgi:HEAT repeat protein
MLESSDKSYRVAVASPVSRLRVHGRTESLLRLLDDPEAEVRLAALRACANTPEAGLVPRVIPHLWNTRTGGAAADALIALGPLTADYLASYGDTAELANLFGRSISLSAILTKIGSLKSLDVLKRVLDFSGPNSTAALVQAYCRIIQRQPAFDPYAEHWESILRCQIDAARLRKNLLARTSSLEGNAFLMGVLREEFDIHMGNVFALLGVLATSVRMEAIRLRLQDKDEEQRSRAQEVLENVLPEKWRDEVIELTDPKLPAAGEAGAAELLREVIETKYSEQVLLGVLYAAALSTAQDALPQIQQLLSHPSGVVRETALFALARIEDPGELSRQCNPLLADANEAVRNLAQSLLSETSQTSRKEESV